MSTRKILLMVLKALVKILSSSGQTDKGLCGQLIVQIVLTIMLAFIYGIFLCFN